MLTREDEFFLAKVEDLAVQAERRNSPRFSLFLDERQAYMAEQHLKHQRFSNFLFFGGFEGAQRKVLGVFPEYMEPDEQLFPVIGLKFIYRKADQLSHRDFLGSFMSLGVKREVIGDILVDEGQTVVCLYEKQFDYFTENVKKIGRVGVSVEPCDLSVVSYQPAFKEISGTVSSLRLDCLVAEAAGTSREKAAQLIRTGLVQCDYEQIDSVSYQVKPGSVFSVRGHGKFVLSQEIRPTKKGRMFVTIQKYI